MARRRGEGLAVRRICSRLCTLVEVHPDPEGSLDRLVSPGLLAENVTLQRLLAVIQKAFQAEARAFESHGFGMAGEDRAHIPLDHRLIAYLSPRGVVLMKSDGTACDPTARFSYRPFFS